MFILAAVPWAYIASYLFTSSTSGFSIYMAINFVLAFLAGLVFSILESLRYALDGKADPYLYLLSFVPVFSASWSFATVYRNGCVKTVFDTDGADKICFGDKRDSIDPIRRFCGGKFI